MYAASDLVFLRDIYRGPILKPAQKRGILPSDKAIRLLEAVGRNGELGKAQNLLECRLDADLYIFLNQFLWLYSKLSFIKK